MPIPEHAPSSCPTPLKRRLRRSFVARLDGNITPHSQISPRASTDFDEDLPTAFAFRTFSQFHGGTYVCQAGISK
jgi:hypothetical protein